MGVEGLVLFLWWPCNGGVFIAAVSGGVSTRTWWDGARCCVDEKGSGLSVYLRAGAQIDGGGRKESVC